MQYQTTKQIARHLAIGAIADLLNSLDSVFDKKRAGVYEITSSANVVYHDGSCWVNGALDAILNTRGHDALASMLRFRAALDTCGEIEYGSVHQVVHDRLVTEAILTVDRLGHFMSCGG